MRFSPIFLLFLLSCSAPAAAQEPTAPPVDAGPTAASPWVLGTSVGLPFYQRETTLQLFTMAVHATHVRPGTVGGDIWIAIVPRLLAEGGIVTGTRLGLVLPAAIGPSAYLIPGAGFTILAGVDTSLRGGGATGALNLNLTALTAPVGGVGVRASAALHVAGPIEHGIWVLELGLTSGRRR